MLLGLLLEPGRPSPTEAALVGAAAAPAHPRLEVLGPLPTVLGAEDGVEVLHPVVQRARPSRPAPLVRVVRKSKEVVVAVGLFRQLGHVAMIPMNRTKTPGPITIQIKLGFSPGDQLGQ